MTAESYFVGILKTGISLDRVYPIKLPQNPTYPAIRYSIDASSDGNLDTIEEAPYLYAFECIVHAEKYADIVTYTDSVKSVCEANQWQLSDISDGAFDYTTQTYARLLRVSFISLY